MLLKMTKPTAPQWVGFGLLWLGGVATLRWMFVWPGLRQLIPGFSEMGLVAPAMFLASGAACVLLGAAPAVPGALSPWRRRAVLACVCPLVAFPSLMLIEYLAAVNLGVDFVRDGFGTGPDVAFPGRMSPHACVAFGLAGLAAYLLLQPATAVRRKTLLALVVGIAVIGAAGCIGYTLRFERLYRLAGANALSLPVAYGLTLLSAGLWLLRERWVVDASAGFHGHEQRISQRSIAVLAASPASFQPSNPQIMIGSVRGLRTGEGVWDGSFTAPDYGLLQSTHRRLGPCVIAESRRSWKRW